MPYIVLGVIDGLLVLTTLVLLFFSLKYQGNLAPNLFSHRVYIMDTEAFSLVEKGSAVVADQVAFSEILPGNIVLFTDEKGKTTVGEVQKSNFDNNVYTFTVKDDAGNLLTVGQSHILGKGIYYSEILGRIISFATSPVGVCCAAVLPCAAFLLWEIIAAIKRKAPQPTVATVKKQYETPTYIPSQQNKDKSSHKEDQIPFEERPAFDDDRQRLVEAAGLYAPQKKPEPVKAAPPPRPTINEKEIDKLIQQVKTKRLNEETSKLFGEKTESPNSSQTKKTSSTPVNVAKSAYQQVQRTSNITGKNSFDQEQIKPMELDIDDKPLKRIDRDPIFEKDEPIYERTEPVREKTPPINEKAQSKHNRSRSSPRLSRLDSLLQEESTSDSRYDINNILKNIEGK